LYSVFVETVNYTP